MAGEKAEQAPVLRIGVLLSIAGELVARAIADGAMAREGRIEIVPGSERELLGRLDAARIEVALTLIRPGAHRFPTPATIAEGYGTAMASDHPLAGRARAIGREAGRES